MQTSDKLQQALVMSKTYLAPNLQNGLSIENNPLKFSQEALIELYFDLLKEIVTEYQGVTDGFPEIPYVFSSPSFRVMLSKTCEYSIQKNGATIIKDPGGYYSQIKNTICISFENALEDWGDSLENFKNWLKEVLRHEFHHASKAILHAAFLMQPEVVVPCKYNTGFKYSYDYDNFGKGGQKAPEKTYRPYNQIVETDYVTQPAFPFYYQSEPWNHFQTLYGNDFYELQERVKMDLDIRKLIKSQYRPKRWMDYLNIDRDYDNETFAALQKALSQGESYCINITFASFEHKTFKVPLCVTEMEPLGTDGLKKVKYLDLLLKIPWGKGSFKRF